jgi:hypothetical protein
MLSSFNISGEHAWFLPLDAELLLAECSVSDYDSQSSSNQSFGPLPESSCLRVGNAVRIVCVVFAGIFHHLKLYIDFLLSLLPAQMLLKYEIHGQRPSLAYLQ